MKIVSTAEMRDIDRATTESAGVPSLTLMENAGRAVADFALAQFPEAERITVICGKGNNGGDGFFAARYLHEAGKNIRLLLVATPGELKGDAAAMYSRWGADALVIRSATELDTGAALDALDADLVIDALLGTGFKPPLDPLYSAIIERMNHCPAKVLAVDIPSGMQADAAGESGPCAAADAVVTFTAPKTAHAFALLNSKREPRIAIGVASIGTPDELVQTTLKVQVITPPDFAGILQPRKPGAHKGNFGHVLVVGGSRGKAGAAAMSSMAALRSGAGLVTAAVPGSSLPLVASFAPELMTLALHDSPQGSAANSVEADLKELLNKATVVAVGPGLTTHADTRQFVANLVSSCTQPMVLDADGLNAFEGRAQLLSGKNRPLVLTPHPGEMAHLAGLNTREVEADRVAIARKFAQQHACILVLKGHRTLVAAPNGDLWVNMTGNPGMATAGSGDVLTGMVAGLIAQHPGQVLESTIAAVYLHGLAGDGAAQQLGEAPLIATDIIAALPQAMERAVAIRIVAERSGFMPLTSAAVGIIT